MAKILKIPKTTALPTCVTNTNYELPAGGGAGYGGEGLISDILISITTLLSEHCLPRGCHRTNPLPFSVPKFLGRDIQIRHMCERLSVCYSPLIPPPTVVEWEQLPVRAVGEARVHFQRADIISPASCWVYANTTPPINSHPLRW